MNVLCVACVSWRHRTSTLFLCIPSKSCSTLSFLVAMPEQLRDTIFTVAGPSPGYPRVESNSLSGSIIAYATNVDDTSGLVIVSIVI